MIVGVPRETFPGERRVALVPSVVPTLAKSGLEVVVEAGAGIEAGYPDADYVAKGSEIEYKLVTVEEADAPKGLISTSSPIGRALLGKKVGDEVQVTTPAGIKDYEVVRLTTIYDEE